MSNAFSENGYMIFTEKNPNMMMILFLLGSVPNKHVPLHLENMICRPQHLCNTAKLHL